MVELLSDQDITAFQRFINRFYALHGRHELPWRRTTNPYHILVSEIMLQQTQVERVIPKYLRFLEVFSTVADLAQASVAEVLREWQGLGYNRRGLNLQRAAQQVTHQYQGTFPETHEELVALPGVGPYTASAILAFAFNQPTPLIETNVRTIFLYHFFPNVENVTDEQLLPLVEQTLDQENPRHWYAALMDYGSYLKSVLPNPNRKSKHYTKQSTFKGSSRQVRGEVIRLLTRHHGLTEAQLLDTITGDPAHLTLALRQLAQEGLITQKKNRFKLPE